MNSYPKVWNLGHPSVKDMLSSVVTVEEKLDGSQFSFEYDKDGELIVRSKGAVMHVDAPEKMFNKAVESVKARKDLLTRGHVYRAEYLSKPKHNTLMYDRVPKDHLMLFDVMIGPETYMDAESKREEGERIGLEVMPVLYEGLVRDAEHVREFLETTSVLGGQKVEGVVLKNHLRFGVDGKPLMAKFVSEAFKEIHGGEWRKENPPQSDIIDKISSMVCTPARWAKAVQHLKEAGKLTSSPRDIGLLIKEVQSDLSIEGEAEVLAMVMKWVMPKVLRSSVHGLPEWYKGELLKGQFE